MSLQEGLVGHWTMDSEDTSGGTLYDKSGYSNNGTLRNGPSVGQSSIIGESYSFDGSDTDINLPRNDDLTPTKAITCSLWANRSGSTGDSQTILLTGRDIAAGVEFRDNRLRIHTESQEYSEFISTIPNGDWTQLSVSYQSGSGGAFYVDGDIVSSIPDGGDIIYPEFNRDAPTIGSHGGGLYHFLGDISDTRIYNRALSDSEINQLYQMRSQRQTQNSLGQQLVSHWTMDDQDTDGGVLYDRGASDAHGSISGPVTGVSGEINEAFEWSGLGSNESITTSGTAVTGAHTISYWINLTALSVDSNNNYREMVRASSGTSRTLIEQGGAISWRPHDGSNFTAGSISLDQWEFVTCVYDGSDRIVYQNADERGRQTINSAGSASDYVIGGSSTFHNPAGKIDDVRVFNRALSESEINQLYQVRNI